MMSGRDDHFSHLVSLSHCYATFGRFFLIFISGARIIIIFLSDLRWFRDVMIIIIVCMADPGQHKRKHMSDLRIWWKTGSRIQSEETKGLASGGRMKRSMHETTQSLRQIKRKIMTTWHEILNDDTVISSRFWNLIYCSVWQEFRMDYYMRQSWIAKVDDCRTYRASLKKRNMELTTSEPSVRVTPQYFSLFWIPDTFVTNAKSSFMQSAVQATQSLEITRIERGSETECQMSHLVRSVSVISRRNFMSVSFQLAWKCLFCVS